MSGLANVNSFDDLFITINGDGVVAIYISETHSVAFSNLTDVSALTAADFGFDESPDTPDPETSNDIVITGSDANDNLVGTEGNDLISSGQGNDLLTGGNGADRFIFNSDSGFNRIVDFGNGNDVIDLSTTDFESFDDLNLVERSGTVFLFINEDSSVEFTGIETVEQLDASDFIL